MSELTLSTNLDGCSLFAATNGPRVNFRTEVLTPYRTLCDLFDHWAVLCGYAIPTPGLNNLVVNANCGSECL